MAMPFATPEAAWTQILASRPSSSSSPADADADRDTWEWALGIILCLLGAGATNLGLTLQKRSFLHNDLVPLAQQKPAGKQPLWLVGLAVFMVGQLMNLLAFGYTSQAVAATLGSFSLVTNGIFAPLLLREKLSKQIVLSIGIIVAGSVAVVLSSSRAPQEYELEELVHLLQRPLFVAYLSVLILAYLASVVIMWREDKVWKEAEEKADAWEDSLEGKALQYDEGGLFRSSNNLNAAAAGVGDNASTPNSNSLQLDPEMAGKGATFASKEEGKPNPFIGSGSAGSTEPSWREQVIPASERTSLLGTQQRSGGSSSSDGGGECRRPDPPSAVTPILAGAILSSCSVLFGKCSIQLLKASFSGDNQFTHPLSWVLTIVFLFCAVAAVGYLNVGLRRGTALFVVPLYYVLNTLLAIVGGLIYFEEFKRFNLLQGALFSLGVATTIAGVWISSRGQVEVEDGGETDSEAEEEEELLSPDSAVSVEEGSEKDQLESGSTSTLAQNTASPEPVPSAVESMPFGSPPRVGPLKPARTAVSPGDVDSEARRRARKLSLTVRFGGEHGQAATAAAAAQGNDQAPRFTRAQSEPGAGLSEAELAAMHARHAQEEQEEHALEDEESVRGSSLRHDPGLSTPQHGKGYGSLGHSLVAQGRDFRTPSQSARRMGGQGQGELPSGVRRARSLSSLTAAQQHSAHMRDQQLKAAGWRRQHYKRYSLDRAAYQSSFLGSAALAQAGEGAAAGANAERRPPPFERRYSVAVLGLGIS